MKLVCLTVFSITRYIFTNEQTNSLVETVKAITLKKSEQDLDIYLKRLSYRNVLFTEMILTDL